MAMGPTILITGGTGSIGRTLVAAALLSDVTQRVIVFSRGATRQDELERQFEDPRLEFVLGDVRDPGALERAMRGGVDVVLHAAALVGHEACEANPSEAVEINATGTQNVIDVAQRLGVPRLVVLSDARSDPSNSTHASIQRCRERIVTRAGSRAGVRSTRICSVRSVPVAGSMQSAIGRVRKQAREGKVVLPSLQSTSFWVSLDRTVELVQTAVRSVAGGELFVPRAPAVSLQDLACELAPEGEVLCAGAHGAEPEHQVLLSAEEAARAVELPELIVVRPERLERATLADRSGESLANASALDSRSATKRLEEDELRSALQDLERQGTPGGRRSDDHPWASDRTPRVGLELEGNEDALRPTQPEGQNRP